ncbi:MAG: hypothetical protein A2Y64_06245 [Candidatus Coatesbacteria bacterium RBG_13_66_14]|uniref:Carbohydrate-binding module family 96 domain-containing protein n=1 Tax=Candidatus Coatesbacteria bacterium RBG_13_66_14 TaxID=1817816 RepID=A0A1F5F4B2_9BACT|nr:MAG: hypothetical protein A2Y64_06245 [Candidatus Coatesbacteria bacterium RBG_13_66_14]
MNLRALPLLLLATTLSALATFEVVLQPDADVGKDSYTLWGQGNFGNRYNLFVSESDGRTYLEFVELDDYSGEGLTLVSAELGVYVFGIVHDRPNSRGGLLIAPADEAWEEMTITWSNQPDPLYQYELEGSVDDDSPSDHWDYLDVTGIVALWLDETIPNHGFVIYNHQGIFDVEFTSSDAVGYWPKLTLTLDNPAVEEASWGAIKAGF